MINSVEEFVHWLRGNTPYDLVLGEASEENVATYSLVDEYGEQLGIFGTLAEIELFIIDKDYDDEHASEQWS